MVEENEEKEEEKGKSNFARGWKIASVFAFLGILFGALVMVPFTQCSCPEPITCELSDCMKIMSTEEIKTKVSTYVSASAQTDDFGITDIQAFDDLFYMIKIAFKEGEPAEYVVSKDGSYIIWSGYLLNLNEVPEPIKLEPEKTEVPEVDLYVFSYCPAGSGAIGSFAPVGKLLYGKAETKIKFYSDMHGPHEKNQNMVQECMQLEYPEKYWDYAEKYVEEVYAKCYQTGEVQCDIDASRDLMELVGIDANKVFTCVEKQGEAIYENEKNDARALELQYSPSLVINGVSFGPEYDRTSEGTKQLVCSAFITAPEECSEILVSDGEGSEGVC